MSEIPPEDVPPVDPFLNQDMMPIAQSAHEMFVAFMAAGFTESQAIKIVTGMIALGSQA